MAVGAKRPPIEALADAATQVASGSELRPALAAIASGTAEALGAELVAVRVVGDGGELVARSVAPEASALAAEVAGTRADADRLAEGLASAAVLRAAEQAGAAVIAVPAYAGERLVGAVEIVRHEPFGADELSLAALAAAQVGLAVRTLAPGAHAAVFFRRLAWLDLAGEALAVGWDSNRTAEQALRVAAAGTGARAGVLWQVSAGGTPLQLARLGEIGAALPTALELGDRLGRGVEQDDVVRALAVSIDRIRETASTPGRDLGDLATTGGDLAGGAVDDRLGPVVRDVGTQDQHEFVSAHAPVLSFQWESSR